MKFVISYSCGKDSTLALHKMIAAGHTPVGLLVMVNKDEKLSWFHGVDLDLLDQISKSLQIPLITCASSGEEYHLGLEDGLRRAKELGAELCVYGDIDIEEHREWGTARCRSAGIEPYYPLWHRDREENTREVIDLGYQCVIKCVRNADLPQHLLGKVLDHEMVAFMKEKGLDVCGENGEYHTVTLGGPIFHTPIPYVCDEIVDLGNTSVISVTSKE
ncbi:MAG TPA: diphthine--ammonia ligase [Methanocorpusculum sp.]|nr:diphthine--ammonia ligase [Methanocorpusculum sp.]